MLLRREDRKEFGIVYKEKFPRVAVRAADDTLSNSFQHGLTRQVGLVISGTAGERVQSSAKLFCQAAVMSGLYSTQKNDNPVTQGTGFSLSEVGASPEPILYTGIDCPDGVIIVSDDGFKTMKERRIFDSLTPDVVVIMDSTLPQPETEARLVSLPFRRLVSAKMAAAAAIGLYLKISGIFSVEAYKAAIKSSYGEQATDYFNALDKVLDLPVH